VNQAIDKLIISKNLMNQAEEALQTSPLETTVFFFGKTKGKKLLATDILIPSKEDYEKRTFGHVYVSPKYIIREFPKIEKQGKTLLVTMHSHPMNELSFGDVNTHMNVVKHYPYQLSGIYNDGRIFFYRFENGIKETSYKVLDLSRFDRQTRLFGEEGQLLVSSTAIALIGVGGGNTKIAFDLASLGIGKLILIDPDIWEEHNRNRVFIPPEFVDKNKAESIKELIKEYYRDVEVEAYSKKAEDVNEEVYSGSDALVVGPDNFMTRVFGNRIVLKLKKQAVFPGAGINSKDNKLTLIGGSVQVVTENSACFECVNSISQIEAMRENLDSEVKSRLKEKYGLGDVLEIPTAPAIASLNDVIGGMALWEIVKLITGIELTINFQVYDALKSEIKVVITSKNPTCLACGKTEEADMVETVDEKEVLNQTRRLA